MTSESYMESIKAVLGYFVTGYRLTMRLIGIYLLP